MENQWRIDILEVDFGIISSKSFMVRKFPIESRCFSGFDLLQKVLNRFQIQKDYDNVQLSALSTRYST